MHFSVSFVANLYLIYGTNKESFADVELVQKIISETEKGKRLQKNGKHLLRKSLI